MIKQYDRVRIMGVWHCFQQYYSYIMAVSFFGGWCHSTQRKSIELRWVNDKHYQIKFYRVDQTTVRNQTHNISGDRQCLGRCKYNNHTIMAVTVSTIR